MLHRVIIPTKILDKEGSQNIASDVMSCIAVVQLRLRIRLTEKWSTQVHWSGAGKLKPECFC